MSADGSWSVCTHEHLPPSFFLARLLQVVMSAQMVHGVLHLGEHLQIVVLFYACYSASHNQ
jgi:hypothetical protein